MDAFESWAYTSIHSLNSHSKGKIVRIHWFVGYFPHRNLASGTLSREPLLLVKDVSFFFAHVNLLWFVVDGVINHLTIGEGHLAFASQWKLQISFQL